eukprot:2723238-Amphidinium_carterae.1
MPSCKWQGGRRKCEFQRLCLRIGAQPLLVVPPKKHLVCHLQFWGEVAQLHGTVLNIVLEVHLSVSLKELKFGIGDGFLQYYLYNWKCPK